MVVIMFVLLTFYLTTFSTAWILRYKGLDIHVQDAGHSDTNAWISGTEGLDTQIQELQDTQVHGPGCSETRACILGYRSLDC